MGHHIDSEGRFQSDKHPLPPDRIRLSLEARRSLRALLVLAEDYKKADPGLAEDLRARLRAIHGDVTCDAALAPMTIMVGGGTLTDESRKQIETFLAARDAHRIQILDVDPSLEQPKT